VDFRDSLEVVTSGSWLYALTCEFDWLSSEEVLGLNSCLMMLVFV
jgi:hypothetical protein